MGIRLYCISSSGSGRINSFLTIDKIIKKAVPISQIIYQRRGRIFIPLRTYYFSPMIRNSLAMKFIYKEVFNINIQKKMSFEQKLFVILLNILTIKKSYIYQYDQGIDIRKQASNKTYYLKILKPYLDNI